MSDLLAFAESYWLAVHHLMWVLLAVAGLTLLAFILDAKRGEW